MYMYYDYLKECIESDKITGYNATEPNYLSTERQRDHGLPTQPKPETQTRNKDPPLAEMQHAKIHEMR
jgi:hypothetical protein